jgi:hypothetical protein
MWASGRGLKSCKIVANMQQDRIGQSLGEINAQQTTSKPAWIPSCKHRKYPKGTDAVQYRRLHFSLDTLSPGPHPLCARPHSLSLLSNLTYSLRSALRVPRGHRVMLPMQLTGARSFTTSGHRCQQAEPSRAPTLTSMGHRPTARHYGWQP